MEKCPLPLFCVPKLSVKLLLQLFRLACGEVSLDSPSRFEDTRIAVMNDPSLPFTVRGPMMLFYSCIFCISNL